MQTASTVRGQAHPEAPEQQRSVQMDCFGRGGIYFRDSLNFSIEALRLSSEELRSTDPRSSIKASLTAQINL
jgi:hypothetical protein